MAYVATRIDESDKEQARQILEDLGLDISSGMRIFLKAVIRHRGIPFSLTEDMELIENPDIIRV